MGWLSELGAGVTEFFLLTNVLIFERWNGVGSTGYSSARIFQWHGPA